MATTDCTSPLMQIHAAMAGRMRQPLSDLRVSAKYRRGLNFVPAYGGR